MRRFQRTALLVSLLLAPTGLAAQDAPAGRGTGVPAGEAPARAGTAGDREVRLLQEQLSSLRDEVARLRARVDVLEQAQAAVGGAGPTEAGGSPRADEEGTAVTQALFSGEVREVHRDRIVLAGPGGDVFSLGISRKTRITRGGERITLRDIPEGAWVQASYDLIANTPYASELVILSEEPRRGG